MTEIAQLNNDALKALQQRAREQFEAFRGRGLSLNMARGKPSPEQLDMVQSVFDRRVGAVGHVARDGTDCRNYGGLQGLPEIRELFSGVMGAQPQNIIAGDNSSLALMHDTVTYALLKGTADSERPWGRGSTVKFLCPSPGYDRHFAICESYGIDMIPVAMDDNGPDMDQVESLLAEDASIKAIWCVPKYSNPTGAVYTDEVVERFARMRTAAKDFRIFWDNAYAVHHLTQERAEIANILDACAKAGNPNRAFVFGSTSKITFAGAGVSLLASSPDNVRWLLSCMERRTIGPDKLNHLRHVALLDSEEGLHELMGEHRRIIAPKFEVVLSAFDHLLAEPRAAVWTKPKGGYFISLDTPPGGARRAVALAKEAGIVMTPAGASYPLGKDPEDRNIRIAPTFPSLEEVREAAEGIALSVLLAVTEGELANRGISA